MEVSLELGYLLGSLILATTLVIVLIAWISSVVSLSVENISRFKTEALYWTAILVSNTLGTALGDFLADSSGLGFAGGALLISSLIALVLWSMRPSERPLG